jgi:periplasmic protein TonB
LQVRVAVVEPSALRSGPPKAQPAPQPTEKVSTKVISRRREIKPLVAPKEVVPAPQAQPANQPAPDTYTGEANEGNSGGAVPGSIGGLAGGGVPAVAPAPPPPVRPAAPIFENEATVRRRRIAGHDPGYPARAESNGIEGVVVAKVIIGPDGRVNDVILMQSHPAFEAAVRDAIAGWKFAPLVVNGTATTVYTVFRFTFKLS